jgi:predicted nuclease of predicted toxin-antitoxin system
MRLLVDACAGAKLARALRAAGHDVVFAGDWKEDPGDEEILALAQAEERTVITRDKDFGSLAVRDRKPHCGIARLVELPPSRELAICQTILNGHEGELREGALITAELHRIRIRKPEV